MNLGGMVGGGVGHNLNCSHLDNPSASVWLFHGYELSFEETRKGNPLCPALPTLCSTPQGLAPGAGTGNRHNRSCLVKWNPDAQPMR